MVPMFPLIVVLILSAWAAYTDAKSRKILNLATFPSIVLGIGFYTITDGVPGLWFSLLGMIVGFMILFIPYLIGGIGAGDVKMLAAIGALGGWPFAVAAFLWAAIFGGLYALFLVIKHNQFKLVMKRLVYLRLFVKSDMGSVALKSGSLQTSLPYGVAIALGVVSVLIQGAIG